MQSQQSLSTVGSLDQKYRQLPAGDQHAEQTDMNWQVTAGQGHSLQVQSGKMARLATWGSLLGDFGKALEDKLVSVIVSWHWTTDILELSRVSDNQFSMVQDLPQLLLCSTYTEGKFVFLPPPGCPRPRQRLQCKKQRTQYRLNQNSINQIEWSLQIDTWYIIPQSIIIVLHYEALCCIHYLPLMLQHAGKWTWFFCYFEIILVFAPSVLVQYLTPPKPIFLLHFTFFLVFTWYILHFQFHVQIMQLESNHPSLEFYSYSF